jgi:hypothetical protein
LTTAFGAGNEPTQIEYETWIANQPNDWFDDTAKVHGLGGARTNIVKATANDSLSNAFGVQQATTFRTTKLVEGETYTLSFLVRGNVSAINYAHIMNVGADNQAVGMNSAVASATAFSRVSTTFIADANSGASTGSYLMISFAGAFTTSSWFEIQEVKLEKGNVVTDWCPAATETSAFNSTTNMWYRIDNERAGYYNATTDEFIGGVAFINSVLMSIAGALTNDATDPECWATVGEQIIGGILYYGLSIYRKSISTTIPVAKLNVGPGGELRLVDKNDVARFYASATSTLIIDAAQQIRFQESAGSTVLISPDGTSYIGVENGNAFKQIAGTKTSL